jgi:hypothetical protein
MIHPAANSTAAQTVNVNKAMMALIMLTPLVGDQYLDPLQ